MKYQLALTELERSALIGILVDHLLKPDSTREWLMVTTNETVTIENLIDLISSAIPISARLAN